MFDVGLVEKYLPNPLLLSKKFLIFASKTYKDYIGRETDIAFFY